MCAGKTILLSVTLGPNVGQLNIELKLSNNANRMKFKNWIHPKSGDTTCSTMTNGAWDKPANAPLTKVGDFPFTKNGTFQIMFRFDSNGINIYVDYQLYLIKARSLDVIPTTGNWLTFHTDDGELTNFCYN